MEHIRLYEEGEYQYAGAFGFIPTLTMYLREDAAEALPLVLVVPGGGYRVWFHRRRARLWQSGSAGWGIKQRC